MFFNLLHSQLVLSFLGIVLAGELAIGKTVLDRVKKPAKKKRILP